LSRDDLPGRNGIMFFFAFTMYFSGGLIPTYMVIRNLKLMNTVWAILIPNAVGAYYIIMARTFIQSNIPKELLEAARMDGCSDFKYLTAVVLPLSKAIIAVLLLFYGVANWNSYFEPMIYLNSKELYPLSLFLRQILILDNIDTSTITDPELQIQLAKMAGVIKYALIIVSTVPVLVVCPFVRKYFVKGVMIGSVKG